MNKAVVLVALVAIVVAACSASPSASLPDAPTPPAAVDGAPSSTPTIVDPPSSALGSPAASTEASFAPEQSAQAGAVTISATWSGPQSGAVVELALDTHSVALDGLTLSDAVLRNDRGDTLPATSWSAAAGSHHRSGELAFSGDATAFFEGSSSIELVLYNIADSPETVLHWDL